MQMGSKDNLVSDLELSRRLCVIKYSRATSCVNWLRGEKTNVSWTICNLVFTSSKRWFFRLLTI
jgi:hypothetical protein